MATGTTAQQIIDVVTPAAGESVSEGTILEWHVKVGDFIRATDTIVEISTDKVDLELPSPASGTVTEILIEEGETVTVGQVIARIAAQTAPTDGGAEAPPARQAPAGARPLPQAPRAPEAPRASERQQAPEGPPAPPAPEPSEGGTPEGGAPAAAPGTDASAQVHDGAKVSPVAARAAA